MTSYFSDIVKDLRDRTDVATNALMESTETAEVSLHFITWNQHPSVSFWLFVWLHNMYPAVFMNAQRTKWIICSNY